jgi:hypothetical protein
MRHLPKQIIEISNRLTVIAFPEQQSCVLILYTFGKPEAVSLTFDELEALLER